MTTVVHQLAVHQSPRGHSVSLLFHGLVLLRSSRRVLEEGVAFLIYLHVVLLNTAPFPASLSLHSSMKTQESSFLIYCQPTLYQELGQVLGVRPWATQCLEDTSTANEDMFQQHRAPAEVRSTGKRHAAVPRRGGVSKLVKTPMGKTTTYPTSPDYI